MVPKDFFAWKVPAQIQMWNHILGLGKNIFYSLGGLFLITGTQRFIFSKMKIQPLFLKNGPQVFFAWKVPAQTWTTFWALEIAVSIL